MWPARWTLGEVLVDVERTLVALRPSGRHLCVLLFGDSRASGISLLSHRSDGQACEGAGVGRSRRRGTDLEGFVWSVLWA